MASSPKQMPAKGLEAIVTRMQAGDQTAVDEFWLTTIERIRRHTGKSIPTPDDADAVALDTVYQAAANIEQYQPRPGASVWSWLYSIANNEIANYYRRRKGEVELKVEAVEAKGAEDWLLSEQSRQSSAEDDDRRCAVQAALAGLSELDQEILYLRYFEDGRPASDRRFDVIGERLGISANTARVRHRRALIRCGVELYEGGKIRLRGVTTLPREQGN